jgi:hypothetical protein
MIRLSTMTGKAIEGELVQKLLYHRYPVKRIGKEEAYVTDARRLCGKT